MVKLFVGEKGSGKTKKMIEMANQSVDCTKGSTVFINKDSRLTCNLKYSIRLINLQDYEVKDINTYVGLIYGIISYDHDIENIYIDSILRHADIELEDLPDFLSIIEKLSDRYNIDFMVSVSCAKESLPEDIKKYTVVH